MSWAACCWCVRPTSTSASGKARGIVTFRRSDHCSFVQSIVGMIIGVAVVAVRRVWVAVLGTGFAASTMAGFLLSVAVGLFGFQDTWSAPFAKEAFLIESASIVALTVAAALCLLKPAGRITPTRRSPVDSCEQKLNDPYMRKVSKTDWKLSVPSKLTGFEELGIATPNWSTGLGRRGGWVELQETTSEDRTGKLLRERGEKLKCTWPFSRYARVSVVRKKFRTEQRRSSASREANRATFGSVVGDHLWSVWISAPYSVDRSHCAHGSVVGFHGVRTR